VGRDGARYGADLGKAKSGIFLKPGLDRANQLDPVQQIRGYAQAPFNGCYELPVYPDERTFSQSCGMSQTCQQATLEGRLQAINS
jgi:hypothetical protein